MFTYASLATSAHPSHLGLDDNVVVKYLAFKNFTYALTLKTKRGLLRANQISSLPTHMLDKAQPFREICCIFLLSNAE